MNLHLEKPAALVQHWHFSLKFKPNAMLHEDPKIDSLLAFSLLFRMLMISCTAEDEIPKFLAIVRLFTYEPARTAGDAGIWFCCSNFTYYHWENIYFVLIYILQTWALWWKYELEDSSPRRQQTGGLWKHDGWQITVSVGSLGRVCKKSSCESSLLLGRSQCSCRRVSGNDINWFLRNGYMLNKNRASTI